MSQQDWTPEDWVWEQIRAGKIADFHARLGRCEPKTSSGWGDDRRLSTAFLRRIFYDKTFLDDIPPEGARIVGAWFPEGLTLSNGHLYRQLWLDQSRFENLIDLSYTAVDGVLSLQGSFVAATLEGVPAIDLSGANIGGQLTLEGATVDGALTMNGLQVGQGLYMQGSKEQPATFASVDLTGAKVDGQLSLAGATVDGALTMNGLQVGQDLYMQGSKEQPATFAVVDLTGAKVDGQLSLAGATVDGALKMSGLQVGRDLYMRGSKEAPATFAAVDLSYAKTGGRCDLSGAIIKRELKMVGLAVTEDLLMQATDDGDPPQFCQGVDLARAKVGGGIGLSDAVLGGELIADDAHVGTDLLMDNTRHRSMNEGVAASLRRLQVGAMLDLEGATCASLDLSASKIAGELRLLSLTWSGDGPLILRNTHASVLHDSDSAWPEQVELEGFTYDRLGGIGEDGDMRRYKRDRRSRWYIRWLEKDRTYSPQPYEQLADVLRKTGEPAIAADVLYEGRERARREARISWLLPSGRIVAIPGWRFIGMTLLKWTIGYGLGLRYFWCVWWILGLTAIGMVLLHEDATVLLGGATAQLEVGRSLIYSLQKLIPLVEFEKFEQVKLGSFAGWYFYVHQLAGYVLALFLGAGLSGLTQKS